MSSYLDNTIGSNRLGTARNNLPNRFRESVPMMSVMGELPFNGKKPVRKNVARRISSSPNKQMTFLSTNYNNMTTFQYMGNTISNFSTLPERMGNNEEAKKQLKSQQQRIKNAQAARNYVGDPYGTYADEMKSAKTNISGMAYQYQKEPTTSNPTQSSTNPTKKASIQKQTDNSFNDKTKGVQANKNKRKIKAAIGGLGGGALIGAAALGVKSLMDKDNEKQTQASYAARQYVANFEAKKKLLN